MIGKYLEDRFRIEERIGHGGMSDVYRGLEVYSQRTVALKVLKNNTPDPATRERFLREAQSQATLDSPHVARIYHFGRDFQHGVLYIAMEYIAGDQLGQLLDVGKLSLSAALLIAIQICEGLNAAHSEGIIHRDLKPANIMLRPKKGRLTTKILDFGFARPIDTDSKLTQQGKIAGTLTYISPEQVRQDVLTPSVDIYTLGVVLFEMITGAPPFEGRSPQEAAIMHLRNPAPRLSDLLEVPAALDALVYALLQKDPLDRPGSIVEVQATLISIMNEHVPSPFQPQHEGPSTDLVSDWPISEAVSVAGNGGIE